MTDFFRRLILACLGLAVLVGALMAGLFVGMALLAVVALVWVYFRLRLAGVVPGPKFRRDTAEAESDIIEAEYVVIEEKEAREPVDKA